MKASLLAKRLISLLCLLLAITMLFAACGGTEETGENGDEQTQEEQNGEDTGDETGDEQQDGQQQDGQQQGNNGKGQQNNQTGNNNNGGSTLTKTTNAFSNSKEANIWKNVPKKEVHLLMWKEGGHPTKSEQKLIQQYEKKTGVNVRITFTSGPEYTKKLVSLISGKDSPDVVRISTTDFPGIAVKALQPLKANVFQLDSDCWDKSLMNAYKINGNYYGVAMPGTWSCMDTSYMTFYNTKLLQQCGVSAAQMPYKLYTQGKWNWDAQKDIINKLKNKGYTGISIHTYDLQMYSAGVDFVTYDGKTFKNALTSLSSSSMIVKAWEQVAGYGSSAVEWDRKNFATGKIGLFTTIAFDAYSEGDGFPSIDGVNVNNFEAVPVAGPKGKTAYVPCNPKCWGIAKGAKNPEGAAYFLRYFLDTSGFNMGGTFFRSQFKTVFDKITSASAKKAIRYSPGIVDYISKGTYTKLTQDLKATSPGNVKSQLDAAKGKIDSGMKRANKDLAKLSK